MIYIFRKSDDELKNEFYGLKSRTDVAKLLEIEDKSLRYYLYAKQDKDKYVTFDIPKKKGGTRKISAPIKELKNIQRKLAYILNLVYRVKPSAYGFIKDKGIKDNAANHTKRKLLLNIDLKDFFSQVHFGRVRGLLMKKPYAIGEEAATVIAQLVCFEGALAQGAPSSPIISNMICSPLDTQLIRLAKKYGLVYTRYADDITLSTNNQFPKEIIVEDSNELTIGSELNSILNRNSFSVNIEKIFLNSSYTRQEVTGLVVNRFPNIKREYIKNLRAILHKCNTMGIYTTAKEYIEKGYCKNNYIVEKIDDKQFIYQWFKEVLKGKINFIKDVRGNKNYIFLKYAQQLNRLFKEEIFNLDFLDEFISNVVILEYQTDDEYVQGSAFFVKDIGLFTSYHVTENGEFYSVKTHKMNELTMISKGMNEISSDYDIDYALYEVNNDNIRGLELGDSEGIRLGDKVIIVGYPDYNENDSPNIQTCEVISKTKYMGAPLYSVSGKIFHGASGGVVLDMNYKVIGIVKAGVVTMEEVQNNSKQGFVPMNIVLEDLNNHKANN